MSLPPTPKKILIPSYLLFDYLCHLCRLCNVYVPTSVLMEAIKLLSYLKGKKKTERIESFLKLCCRKKNTNAKFVIGARQGVS